ncbi:DEAD/DEAH box helicase [Sulfitobacter pseudonitzschiae]|uniref:DEAD-box ATP-dependent RNA helicase RhpA n=1 Tax=Pseudosulfitobacter pseudonitzschiae TaxID=1402135 RepID=A0A9Q2RZ67_9RHOB|nr:DEAD/DEAH box helicase [Pseudosulfitobacter pseudonitzschiae]MBM2291263.1 DEAD/DEAH box helicase [Pseudosulfitobacter pseudonitzschiae]MBM2296181.1 DEAD/DEAH box helicase [Pseudosulfitobacter pseudonitzschiae]MBM2301094.1 DEAD/DEAH box helicase [Pseudosulfitobacter pseudonitzschiae]MBM2310878.1 DEAD/DEAH box helicase [Pseudosulfitobacter pseudonitzschiae]MBM2315791.1 DEAD/DEAH box helicase [Pseudosulfitobacter pseudonitzschiae]
MTKFSDLNLNPKVLKAIEEAGYETPTPIQAGAIPPALDGRDVLGIAQTGTGKTAGFVLPMITLLARGRARARMPRSLVLCPTRELAAQVAENFDTYTKHLKLTKALLIGGVSFKEQDTLIDKGVDVLIATPGRLLDHFERGKLILSDVKVMVVDEADRMLDMGFIPDIERIFGLTPFTRQTLFFSATMAPEIERITNTFLSNPARIEVARQASASETIEQGVVMFKGSRKDREASEKRKVLRMLIDAEGDKCTNAIIFCNRKTDVDIVAKSLNKYGYDAAPIHGDLDQSQRTRTLDGFRAGTLRFLVASDVAARGLDVPSVSHVFNFDVPSHAEDYVHRIGRTGRAGRDGKAVMICVPRDEKNFEDIERLIQREIPRLENPLGHIGAEAQGDAPEDTTEKKPTSSRSRSRSRSRKTDNTPKVDTAAENTPQTQADAAPVQADKPAETPKPEAAPAETRAEPSNAPRDNQRTESRQDSSDSKRSSSSRSRSNRDDRGGRVMGLGDHTPTFIEKSFAERYDG